MRWMPVTVKRISEPPELVCFEIDERHVRNQRAHPVNTMTGFEFDAHAKICRFSKLRITVSPLISCGEPQCQGNKSGNWWTPAFCAGEYFLFPGTSKSWSG